MLGPLRDILREQEWQFAEHERPAIPGSPANPDHATPVRVAYGALGVLLGLTGGFGTALISVNTTTLQGALGLDPSEIAWLPTAYVMTNASMNLLLIKYRQQYGLRSFAMIFLGLYVLFTAAHLLVHGFASAIAVRAASGMAGAALSSLALYYMMQALPGKWRLKAIVLGIGIPQCATPIARLFSPELLAMAQWRTLYLFELGLALLCLAGVSLLRLPPAERRRAFEPLDFVTFTLFTGAVALVAAVLGEGRYVWWSQAWIGWSLAAAIPLFLTAIAIEHRRQHPLLNIRWLGSADILRFTVVTLMARIVFSEQTFAAVGLLATLGQNNDQMQTLFVVISLAAVLGVIASAVTIDPERLTHPVMFAIGLVAVAAFIDSHATNLTRAPQMYVTQGLIAFSTTFFIGPALLFGMTRALKQGAGHIITFFVLFGILNGIGTLAGSAVLGTYQIVREKANSAALVQAIDPTDPIVAQRITAGGSAVGRVIGDPTLQRAEGTAILAQSVAREANVLAYDDVFRLVALLSGATTLYLAFILWRRNRRARRDPAAA